MAIGQIGMSGALVLSLAEVVKRGENELAPTPHQRTEGRSVLGKAKKRGHATRLLAQVNIIVSFVLSWIQKQPHSLGFPLKNVLKCYI